MKRVGMFLVGLLFLFSVGFVLADAGNCSTGETWNGTDCVVGSSGLTDLTDLDNTEKAFACLETEVEDDCSGADSVQETALTILASPSEDIASACVDQLYDYEKIEDCFGDGSSCNLRDTALAILALDHVGEDTASYEEWLIDQNMTSEDLVWYLEEDSEGDTECSLSYDGEDYTINVDEMKKISGNPGPCFTPDFSNFLLQIRPGCYENLFRISCDQNYKIALVFKVLGSNVINVLSDTIESAAYDETEVQLRSQCFGVGSSCDYEGTAWATLALLELGYDVSDYFPYLIAGRDVNQKYLPNAFIYMATGYDDYSTELISEQNFDYWLAPSSRYGKFYDTALALMALSGGSSDVVDGTRGWLNYQQAEDGCWNNDNIRDTAFILWASEGRSSFFHGHGDINPDGGTTTCSQGGFFCITSSDCPSDEVMGNFFCSGSGTVCCENEHLKSCSEYYGEVCSDGKVCDGAVVRSTDGECCRGDCVEPATQSECESNGNRCRISCGDGEVEVNEGCTDTLDVCCESDNGGSFPWGWVIFIIILVALVAAGYFFRNKLKELWNKLKAKLSKNKGGSSPAGGFPPRGGPGVPPGMPPRGMPMRRPMPRPNAPISSQMPRAPMRR
jgi:hypothetical protein